MKTGRLGRFYGLQITWVHLICLILFVLSIIPFWILIVNGTRSTEQIQQSFSMIPSIYARYNYDVLTGRGFNIWRGFVNSFTVAASATALTLYFSALTAYGLVIYEFKGKNFIFAVIAFILMIPTQVSMVGFYRMVLNMGLVDTYWPLILPGIANPATVFFIRQYLLSSFPKELVNAARIDGASEIRIYHTIALPIMRPALATMGIFAFVASWNNFLMPLMIISEESKYTLPMLVQLLKTDIYRTEYGGLYLGIAMTVLPLLLVYLALSRYIIAGVALGGLKE